MARASYQHIPNIVLGQPKPKKIKKVKIKGANFSPDTSYSPPTRVAPPPSGRKILKLKFG